MAILGAATALIVVTGVVLLLVAYVLYRKRDPFRTKERTSWR